MSGRTLEHIRPWAGIAAAALGWALAHQVGSDTVFDDCDAGGGFVILVCLVGLAITLLGGFHSLGVWRGADSEGRRFLGLLGALLSLLAAFAIILQAAAGLILPPCAG